MAAEVAGQRKYEEKLVGCGGWGEAAGGGRAWGFRRNGAGDAGVLVIFLGFGARLHYMF